MKAGDMVQYIRHATWENGGLGVVTDVNPSHPGGIIQITWLDDIEDYRWNDAISDWSFWYDDDDFEKDIQLFAEAT